MPLQRSYSPVKVSVLDSGKYLPDLPQFEIALSDYTEKTNWERFKGTERKRCGWDYPAPTELWTADMLGSFDSESPCEAIKGIRRPNGTYAIVGCGGGKIKAFNYDLNEWVTIGSGYSVDGDTGFLWWQIEDVAGYAVFNNGRDLLCTWQVGDDSVLPIYEFREQGYASCGHITEYYGVLMCANILEIEPADMSVLMNSPLPYRTITGSTYVMGDAVWTAETAAAAQIWAGIAWSPELHLFAAVSQDGTNHVMTSPDGVTWTLRVTSNDSLNAIAWSPDLALFCAVGAGVIMTSPDGITWTDRVPAIGSTFTGICWSDEVGLFVAVANAGGTRLETSPDGINWTERNPPSSATWNAVTWSPELHLFCAVAAAGSNLVMTSPDGLTWTARTAAAANGWTGIAWSPELRLFCAVGGTIGTTRIMTSPDGTTWTSRTHPLARPSSISWSPTLGVFVIACITGTDRFLASTDGITWTAQANPSGQFFSIAWSPELGIFAAPSGSTAIVATSDAGMTLIETTRIGFERVWSNLGAPRDFAAVVAGTIDGYPEASYDLVLAWPMASLAVGDLIRVTGAGASGGNLSTTIAAIDGVYVTLTDPATTAVTDASVAKETAFDSIVGSDELEGDGSTIIREMPLKNQLVSYKESGEIFQSYYTGQTSQPFASQRMSGSEGAKRPIRFPRALVNILDRYHLFPGADHFYQYQLSAQEPVQHDMFFGAETTRFFNLIAGVDRLKVWAADNAAVGQAYFAYPLGTDSEESYEEYSARAALSFTYREGDESIDDIDGFNFLCGITVCKPVANDAPDPTELWFLMGDTDGRITLYGRSNTTLYTNRRYGELFDSIVAGGLHDFGNPTIDKYIKRFTLLMAQADASGKMTLELYGARQTNADPVLLATKDLTNPVFPGVANISRRRAYLKYRFICGLDSPVRFAGHVWLVAGQDIGQISQLAE